MNHENLQLQVPPQNLGAERSLLGCFVFENDTIEECGMRPEHFYSDMHKKICGIALQLRKASVPFDSVLLAEELTRSAGMTSHEAYDVATKISEAVPHATHAKYYAGIVRKKWLLREALAVLRESITACFREEEPEDILAATMRQLGQLDSAGTHDGLVSLSDSCNAVLQAIEERQNNQVATDRISTGFAGLDSQLSGFRKSQLIVLAARPGMGKSALALNIAAAVMHSGSGVLFISLEMSHQELTERLLSSESGINGRDITAGTISAHQWHVLRQHTAAIRERRLWYLDKSYSLDAIASKARVCYRKHGVRFIVADYIQLVDAEQKRGMVREQAVAAVSREMKRLAVELQVPVLALSQLNRDIERRDDKRPRLADLRESGAIEQDANVVLMLHRPDAHDAENRPGEAELIIAKNRSGPTGIVRLMWQKEFCRFIDAPALSDVDVQEIRNWK
jgi:replicative DNA helicase